MPFIQVLSRASLTAAAALVLALTPTAAQQRLSESTGVNLFSNHCTKCRGTTPVERAPAKGRRLGR